MIRGREERGEKIKNCYLTAKAFTQTLPGFRTLDRLKLAVYFENSKIPHLSQFLLPELSSKPLFFNPP
jgi:hypothetical protein